eukprot:CAMPEP_0197664292 /NCGR_PEP_ID=MMETSP1338-20131121/58546_1 /TAXON_ID=43686 ORGANISM="Pelagodinium beii, Strain RCC1491" /NCGR_SAMPLE_ID=MMETSP1338 /ASSEMBLY_ACC=CAM_ASM_000754 /LENGTH=455 /DNA_ID=CAMNT_0043242905 /DNA_START=406 /DNA_END=1773 /DNA_ORIENTATION=+
MLLDKKSLIEQLKKASGGKEVNMAMVEDTLQHDKERRKLHKQRWRSRWRIFFCGFSTLALTALTVLVVIFAISPWTQLCDDCGWSGRAYFGAALTPGGRIILLGGRDASHNFGDVWSGSKDGTDWKRLLQFASFEPRHGHALLCDRNTGELFLLGGDAGSVGGSAFLPMRDAWLSTDGQTWVQQTSAAPWAARKFFGANVDSQGRLYIAGGLSGHGNGGLNDVWRSQDKGISWEPMSLAAPWSARHSIQLVRMLGGLNKDRFYILGGTDGFAQHDVWEGDGEGTGWELMRFTHHRESSYDSFEHRASWRPRAAAAAVADSNGLLKIFGGLLDEEGPEGYFSREAWQLPSPEGPPSEWWQKQSNDDRLNVRSKPLEWLKTSDPPWSARAGLQGFVDPEDNAAYIVGGEDRLGFKADLWKEAFSINFDNLYNMIELTFLRFTASQNATSTNTTADGP